MLRVVAEKDLFEKTNQVKLFVGKQGSWISMMLKKTLVISNMEKRRDSC